MQPRLHRGAPLEAAVRTECTEERFLDRVLSLERRREHPIAVRDEIGAMLLELPPEVAVGRDDRRPLHESIVRTRAVSKHELGVYRPRGRAAAVEIRTARPSFAVLLSLDGQVGRKSSAGSTARSYTSR